MDLHTINMLATEIARDVATPESAVADREGTWVGKTMKALQNGLLTGLVVPARYSGQGQGLHAMTQVCEILGTAYGSAGLCFGMHCVGAAVIASKATGEQQQEYLEPIARGKHLTTLALSEPGTGAHFYYPQTSLSVLPTGQLLVNGAKTFVTNGGHADSYVISTLAASPAAATGQFSCILVDAMTEGLRWGPEWEGIGMRGNASRSMQLDQTVIPASHILGEPGDQLWYIFQVVAPYFLCAMAGTYLGIARHALQEATETLRKRSYAHNGGQLAHVAVLQHRLGQMWSRVESTRRLIYHAAQAGDQGDSEAMLSILAAKAEVAACAVETVNDAMTLAGGIGYAHNATLGLLLRDSRAADVMSPTTDLLYTWLGRALLDQPILSD